jgi:hypothetical protein
MNTASAALLVALALVPPIARCADDPPPAATDKSLAGRAREVGAAVSRDAKAVGHAAKEGAIKVAHAAKKGADKVKDKVKNTVKHDKSTQPAAPAPAPSTKT